MPDITIQTSQGAIVVSEHLNALIHQLVSIFARETSQVIGEEAIQLRVYGNACAFQNILSKDYTFVRFNVEEVKIIYNIYCKMNEITNTPPQGQSERKAFIQHAKMIDPDFNVDALFYISHENLIKACEASIVRMSQRIENNIKTVVTLLNFWLEKMCRFLMMTKKNTELIFDINCFVFTSINPEIYPSAYTYETLLLIKDALQQCSNKSFDIAAPAERSKRQNDAIIILPPAPVTHKQVMDTLWQAWKSTPNLSLSAQVNYENTLNNETLLNDFFSKKAIAYLQYQQRKQAFKPELEKILVEIYGKLLLMQHKRGRVPKRLLEECKTTLEAALYFECIKEETVQKKTLIHRGFFVLNLPIFGLFYTSDNKADNMHHWLRGISPHLPTYDDAHDYRQYQSDIEKIFNDFTCKYPVYFDLQAVANRHFQKLYLNYQKGQLDAFAEIANNKDCVIYSTVFECMQYAVHINLLPALVLENNLSPPSASSISIAAHSATSSSAASSVLLSTYPKAILSQALIQEVYDNLIELSAKSRKTNTTIDVALWKQQKARLIEAVFIESLQPIESHHQNLLLDALYVLQCVTQDGLKIQATKSSASIAKLLPLTVGLLPFVHINQETKEVELNETEKYLSQAFAKNDWQGGEILPMRRSRGTFFQPPRGTYTSHASSSANLNP